MRFQTALAVNSVAQKVSHQILCKQLHQILTDILYYVNFYSPIDGSK